MYYDIKVVYVSGKVPTTITGASYEEFINIVTGILNNAKETGEKLTIEAYESGTDNKIDCFGELHS